MPVSFRKKALDDSALQSSASWWSQWVPTAQYSNNRDFAPFSFENGQLQMQHEGKSADPNPD